MDDQDVIRDQMQQTRTALADKLEKLEDQVSATVQGASREVTATVATVTESVQETVESVKDTVEDTVETVKDTVHETLEAVKHGVSAVKNVLDVPSYVEHHPWVALGGSIFVGYLLGDYVLSRSGQRRSRARVGGSAAVMSALPAGMATIGQTNGRHNVPDPAPKVESSSKTWSLFEKLEPDLTKLKGLAVGALMGTIRDAVVDSADDRLGAKLGEIIDGFTEKLGGTVVPRENREPSAENEQPAMSV